MGDGTAWGGRLLCKQKFRWDRYPYPPPLGLGLKPCMAAAPPKRKGKTRGEAIIRRRQVISGWETRVGKLEYYSLIWKPCDCISRVVVSSGLRTLIWWD